MVMQIISVIVMLSAAFAMVLYQVFNVPLQAKSYTSRVISEVLDD